MRTPDAGLLVVLSALTLDCGRVESMQPPDWARESTSTDAAALDPVLADVGSARFPAPLRLADATMIMMLTNTFAVNWCNVNFPPRHVLAFNVILDSPDARERFETIFLAGSQAGKLYALAAFALLDPSRYGQAADLLNRESGEVHTVDGCLYETELVSQVVMKIERNRLGDEFRRRRQAAYEHYDQAG